MEAHPPARYAPRIEKLRTSTKLVSVMQIVVGVILITQTEIFMGLFLAFFAWCGWKGANDYRKGYLVLHTLGPFCAAWWAYCLHYFYFAIRAVIFPESLEAFLSGKYHQKAIVLNKDNSTIVYVTVVIPIAIVCYWLSFSLLRAFNNAKEEDARE